MDPADFSFPEGKAGDYFTEAHWDAFVKVARALLAADGPGPVRKPWVRLKLTSVSSGAYAWTRVVRDSAGWVDTAEAGTTASDPAKPADPAVSLSTFPAYVLARREPTGEMIFDPPSTAALVRVLSPSGGIAARSGGTPGSATCTLCTWNGTTWTSTGGSLTVKSDYPTAVAGSKLLWVTPWGSDYFVVTEQC
jgi:hypothetical protein